MKYQKLRDKMKNMDVRGGELAKLLHIHQSALSQRMTGRTSWHTDEAYLVMQYLDIPFSDIYYYFPPNGDCVGEPARDDGIIQKFRELRDCLNAI